jgi:uncharacterized membrane protein
VPSERRREYVDWARGVAVLLMIEAHTTDAWTAAASKNTTGFRDATILGGFAAPLFLWLAGLAVVLAASRTMARSGSRAAAADAVCRRGLEVFLLGFLFRLQAFIVSPGSHPIALFRVDILNVMGLSMVGAGLVWASTSRAATRAAVFAALAAAIALVTPIVRATPVVDALPTWLQWYLRPAGEHTTFTLLPWSGFVFAGGAAGALLDAASDRRAEARVNAACGLTGAALVAGGFWAAAQPSIYAASSFWTSSPTWFAIRVGILMMALSALYLTERSARGSTSSPRVETLAPLARIGRASLFIYWIHVELVYGYATWPIHGRLPLAAVAAAYVLFCAAMYGVLGVRDRLLAARRAAGRPPTYSEQPMGAAVE